MLHMEFNTAGKREGKGTNLHVFFSFLFSFLILRQGSTDTGEKDAIVVVPAFSGTIATSKRRKKNRKRKIPPQKSAWQQRLRIMVTDNLFSLCPSHLFPWISKYVYGVDNKAILSPFNLILVLLFSLPGFLFELDEDYD